MDLNDSDIEIVERTPEEKSVSRVDDFCQLCNNNLHGLTVSERDAHYNGHIQRKETGPQSKRRRKPVSVISTQQRSPPTKIIQDVFWFPAQSAAPPDNYSPGVLSVLKDALKKAHRKGINQRAVLCYERTPHILREKFDTGWGCGYRNFMMACAALMDQQDKTIYFPYLDSPLPPSVRNLQRWIEDAWNQGYDEVGARDLKHELADTKKQIGTGELYVAFTSRRIPCMLVDFDLEKSPKGFDAVVDWVVNYFTEKPEGDVNKVLRTASPVVATSKMPVIMQFKGHSVTIVGYELVKNDKYNLLVLDPSSKVSSEIRQAALNTTASTNPTSSSLASGKGKRREQSGSPTPRKRARTSEDPDDDVVTIPDSDDEKKDDARRAVSHPSSVDSDKVIKAFKLANRYMKKPEYQLLYFTMGDPLSDQEQDDRKVVLAEC